MKHLTTGLCFATLLIGMASCAADEGFEGVASEQGGIVLNLTTDGRVMRQTRADDGVSPVVPGASEFGISLAKSDGTYSRSWSNLDLFNREASFGIGDYELTASWGDPNLEGYQAPYYTGKTQVHVSPGATTEANVVATLANAMVSIRYTDAFTDAFQAYSAAVQTEGHEWLVFAKGETRPAYITPSDVKLNLTLTNESGRQVTIQPAGFKAEARHHYVVTIGVTQNSGDLALDIEFDDEVVSETVNVSLGDDLFNAPAPTVTPKGFDPAVDASTFEYAEYQGNAQFDIIAFGGIKGVTLNVISDNGFTPSFGRSAELVNPSDVLRTQLETEGIECAGLFRNVDKMGAVNIDKFLANLPAGKYTVELQAVDLMTRTTEPVSFTVEVQPLQTSLAAGAEAEFLGTEISVDLSTNCEGIRDKVTFKVPNEAGQMVDAHIKSVTAITAPSGARTRAGLPYTYRYVLAMERITKSVFNVEVTVGKKAAETVAITVGEPEYSVVADAFARKVVLKIEAEESLANYISDNVQIQSAGTAVSTSNITHNGNEYITVSGLNPSTTYPAFILKLGAFEKTVPVFTTEADTDVPNGTFSDRQQTISIPGINVGSQFKNSFTVPYYQVKSGISVFEPAGWASINSLTCYTESENKNTWYLVPSTLMDGNTVNIRSVGYSHSGPGLAVSGGTGNTKYYGTTTPASSDLQKAAGELFLGSYSFDGSVHRTDGVAFASRPAGLTFSYSYVSRQNEDGEVYVRVLGDNDKVLSEAVSFISATSEVRTMTLPLTYSTSDFGSKAVKVAVGFKSTKSDISVPDVYIPVGTELKEGGTGWNRTIPDNTYHALATGSELKISNVHFTYEDATATRAVTKGGRR